MINHSPDFLFITDVADHVNRFLPELADLVCGGLSSFRVDIDNSLFLAELHLGGYIRGRLSDRITTYAAAGPMVMYGYHEVEDENLEDADGAEVSDDIDLSETDSSDINLGFYGRAGVDFEIRQDQHLGFGIRYMSSELDFDKTVGELDVEGPQYVFTYSARF